MRLQLHRALLVIGFPLFAFSVRGQQVIFSDNFDSDTTAITGWTWANNPAFSPTLASDVNSVAGNSLEFSVLSGGLQSSAIDVSSAFSAGETITFSFDYYSTDAASTGMIIALTNSSGAGSFYWQSPTANVLNGVNLGDASPVYVLPSDTSGWVHESYDLTTVLNGISGNPSQSLSNLHIYIEDWGAGGSASAAPTYFDNIEISASSVPEPSSFMLWACAVAGLGALGATAKRRFLRAA